MVIDLFAAFLAMVQMGHVFHSSHNSLVFHAFQQIVVVGHEEGHNSDQWVYSCLAVVE